MESSARTPGIISGPEAPSQCLDTLAGVTGIIRAGEPDFTSMSAEFQKVREPAVLKAVEALAGVDEARYLSGRLLSVPVNILANELAEAYRDMCFKNSVPLIRKWPWPSFAPACAIVTHDIDTLNNPPVRYGPEFMKYVIARKLRGRPYNDNMDNILDMEKRHGVNATYFFFSDYGKHQAHFREMLGWFPGNHEIGLHGTQHSFQSHDALARERGTLEKLAGRRIRGIRQHGLNMLYPHTWRYQEAAGFEYDMSHAYNDRFGFRAGTCHPFHPFDCLTGERLRILEIPTSFMDWTALDRGLKHEGIMAEFRKLAGVVEENNGVLGMIFHNMYINERSHPDITAAFGDILDYIGKKNYWIASAGECAEWWLRRESAGVVVEKDGESLTLQADTDLPVVVEYPNGEVRRLELKARRPEVC